MNKRLLIDRENPSLLKDIASATGVLYGTNIWLRVMGFYTDTQDSRSRAYSWLHKHVLENELPIYLPQVIISEYVNVTLKAIAESSGWSRSKGKLHHQSDYGQWMTDISDYVHHISTDCNLIDDEFSSSNIDDCFSTCKSDLIDFNDVLIAELCHKQSLLLVTDDADMKSVQVDIVTANKNLL